MKLLRILAALVTLAVPSAAFGQAQLGAGQVWANPTAARAPAISSTVSALLDRALGSTRGAIIERGAAGWVLIGPGTTGLPFVSAGAAADPLYQVLSIAGGGTGATTQAGAVTATMPTPTRAGDIVYWNGSNWVALAGNNSGTEYLQETSSGVPSWSVFATVAQTYAGTASVAVAPTSIYPAEVTVTFGSTTTFDFSTFINAAVTLTNNITTMTLSNVTAGKSGVIRFIQDGTGSRTTVWNSIFKFSGGITPTLTTTPAASDDLFYTCISASRCDASLGVNYK